MEVKSIGAVIGIAGFALSSTANVVSNWVADASFEGLSVWSEPNDDTSPWFSTGEGANNAGWVARELTTINSGSQALRYSTWAGNAAALQDLELTLDSNTVYELSFEMRLDNQSGNAAHTNETNLGVVFSTSPTFGGTYSWSGKSIYALAPSTTGVWETITLTIDGSDSDLIDNHGEYIRLQLKKFNNAKNSEYEIFVDDVSFGEYAPAPAPEGLLLGFFGSKLTNADYHAEGVEGALYASSADGSGIDESAGSSDGTYGSLSGATILPTGYKVHMGNTNKNQHVDVQIRNETGAPLQLDAIHFDYGRWFAGGPQDIGLSYAYGDLAGITNDTELFTATNLAVTGTFGDYHDFNISLTNLSDRVLGLDERATFRLSIDNAVGIWDKGAFDNIGIRGGDAGITAFDDWIGGYGLTGSPDADPDYDYDQDGWDNLMEYGMGGSPINGFIEGNIPSHTNAGNAIEYVYAMRSNDPTLSYWLEVTDDLVFGSWTNAGYSTTGTNQTVGTFDFVTNSIPIDDIRKFIRLNIEQ